jgi:cellulose synthase/poly-beta-1,6-N-acetylglucosamine synthase-like glycosyltransferase
VIPLVILFAGFVVSCILCQSLIVFCFVWRVSRYHSIEVADSELPKAAIAVAVRGLDPCLAEAIRGLLRQDYPDYHVYIVVDSVEDQAWDLVKKIEAEQTRHLISVQCLTEPLTTCSLKNSALIQIIENLDDSREIVAFIDGDATPHPRWLRDLVTPLLDPRVGVTTGNRWYAPREAMWGSLVRYVWNVGAAVQMWLNNMVWAGSMAIKRSVIEEADLSSAWAKSLSTDAVLCREIRKHGHRVRFVPSVIMINREGTPLSDFVTWVQRQLLTAKLYHPQWSVVWIHALFILGVQLLGLTLLACAIAVGNGMAAAIAALGLLVYWCGSAVFVVLAELAVRRAVGRSRQRPAWLSLRTFLRLLVALPLTNVVYPYAVLAMQRTKEVSWRGVRYRVRGADEIEIQENRPCQSEVPKGCM